MNTAKLSHSCEDGIARHSEGEGPVLQKWTQVPDNYEQIYQQMLSEMQ